jgi:hypothetical protein
MDSHLTLQALLQEELADSPLIVKQSLSPGAKKIIFNDKIVKPKMKKKLRRPKRPFSSKSRKVKKQVKRRLG